MKLPGRYVHRITLEHPVETPDGAGGVTRSWATTANLWASIDPAAASERFANEQIGGMITHHIVIRHRTGITTAHRFRKGGRLFRILAIQDYDYWKRFIEFKVEEHLP